MKKWIVGMLGVLLLGAIVLHSQQVQQQESPLSRVAGVFVASNYNTWQSQILTGNTATGSQSIVVTAPSPLQDGHKVPTGVIFGPLLQPIEINDANEEVVTPTAISIAACGAGQSGLCATITASFNNLHGGSAIVVSGTGGLGEAVNDASNGGGGTVVLDNTYQGTNTTIATVVPSSTVGIEDERTPSDEWFTIQPTTLSTLATPTTLVGNATCGGTATVCSGSATGTWPNSTEHFCVSYVDILGQESACSADASFTATLNKAIVFTSPAASTGAVGWIPYGGLSASAANYRLSTLAANCTLTTLETVVPACAIGANAIVPNPTTATALRPGYVVNQYNTVPAGHTTFAYVPVNGPPGGTFETWFGPFTATANVPSGNVAVLGTVNLPVAYLNFIGKAIRITGNTTETGVNTATPEFQIALGPTFTTGTPTAVCTIADTTNLTAAVNNSYFSCTLTTNSTGATGTLMPMGFALTQLQAGTTAGAAAVESDTAAVTDSLTGSDTLFVVYTTTTAATNPIQLLSLHIETLN